MKFTIYVYNLFWTQKKPKLSISDIFVFVRSKLMYTPTFQTLTNLFKSVSSIITENEKGEMTKVYPQAI